MMRFLFEICLKFKSDEVKNNEISLVEFLKNQKCVKGEVRAIC